MTEQSNSYTETPPVIDVANEPVSESPPVFQKTRRLALAGLGAVAYSIDEANMLLEKLADRGRTAEDDLQTLLKDWRTRTTQVCASQQQTLSHQTYEALSHLCNKMEEGVETTLERFDIPTRRKVSELQQTVDRLKQQVAELSARERDAVE